MQTTLYQVRAEVGNSQGVRGLVAVDDVSLGDVIVSVPASCIVSVGPGEGLYSCFACDNIVLLGTA